MLTLELTRHRIPSSSIPGTHHLLPVYTLLPSICPGPSLTLELFLAAGCQHCAPPWTRSSSGPSSFPISQLPPAMPQRVELVSSDMSRLLRFLSTRIISIIYDIRIVSHFAFTPRQSRAVWMMIRIISFWCPTGHPHSTRASGVVLTAVVVAPLGLAAPAQATSPAGTTSSREALSLARHL